MTNKMIEENTSGNNLIVLQVLVTTTSLENTSITYKGKASNAISDDHKIEHQCNGGWVAGNRVVICVEHTAVKD